MSRLKPRLLKKWKRKKFIKAVTNILIANNLAWGRRQLQCEIHTGKLMAESRN